MRTALLLLLAVPFSALSLWTEVLGSDEGLVVRVAQGLLRGTRLERGPDANPRTVYAFEGVPYARPPVGSLRFQDPKEAEAWTGIKDATQYGPICIQKDLYTQNVNGEEDCLFINVFTADPPATWKRKKRPVIVYFHPGAYIQLSGNLDAYHPDPMLRQGVMFVSLNYRLAVMGFLNTEDSQAPGNAGLKDQVLALRWVRKNIAAFGGDPRKVTILGESAGASSVHFHMMSPLSQGLYRYAISLSGSASANVYQPSRNALALRQFFNASCPTDAPHDIVSCLQRIDARELVFNQYEVPSEQFQYYFLPNPFLPSVETPGSTAEPFLPADPMQLLQEGRFQRVPYITGYTSGEGILALEYAGLLQDPSKWAEFDDNFAEIVSWGMPEGLNSPDIIQRVRQFYLGDRSLRDAPGDLDLLLRFVQMLTDFTITLGTVTSALLMSLHGAPVYVYQFSRDGPIGFIKASINASHIPGVIHADDLPYLFDFANPLTGELLPVPASEQPLRERQAQIFTNMAKYGNPTPGCSGLTPWPLYTVDQQCYLDMGEELRVYCPALGERFAFWLALISNGTQQVTTTSTTVF